jgi:hypothetical protein
MKTTLIALISIFLTTLNGECQEIIVSDNMENEIYYLLLKKYINENKNNFKYQEILLEFNLLSSKQIPKQVEEYEIIQIVLNKLVFKRKKIGDDIEFVRIVPMRFVDGRFVVNIIKFSAEYKNKNIDITHISGSEYEFIYDCDNKILKSLF